MNGSSIISEIRRDGLRGLVIRQPYAELMFMGKVETRVWNTSYRGWVAIIASKHSYGVRELARISGCAFPLVEGLVRGKELHRGKVLGLGRLSGVTGLGELSGMFTGVGEEWYTDLYGWVFTDVVRVRPVDVTGRLGLWRLNSALVDKLEVIE